MQSETHQENKPVFYRAFYRSENYSQEFLRRRLLFLLLPSTVILLLLPILLKTPVLFVVAAVTLPTLALVIFTFYKKILGTFLAVSGYGLEYHEGVDHYTCTWDNVLAVKEVRVGFSKVRGLQLKHCASRKTESWYKALDTLATLTGSSSSSNGSPNTKGGRFMPVSLFAPNDNDGVAEVWQLIRQQAGWAFAEVPGQAHLQNSK